MGPVEHFPEDDTNEWLARVEDELLARVARGHVNCQAQGCYHVRRQQQADYYRAAEAAALAEKAARRAKSNYEQE
eukprot:11840848-Heterocapsa_arctica.AAC.1